MLEQDVDTVRRIVVEALRGTGGRAYLFGSAARGTMRKTSDIDVAVLTQRHLRLGLLAKISEALHESAMLPDVDLVDLSDTDNAFRERVLKGGVAWTE